MQVYIGNRRGKKAIRENRDVLKELRLGMMVAITATSEIPMIAEVSSIEPNPTLESRITVTLFEQESNKHKPKWLRYFKKTAEHAESQISDIILYDFELTRMGALRKSTRDFLMEPAHQESL